MPHPIRTAPLVKSAASRRVRRIAEGEKGGAERVLDVVDLLEFLPQDGQAVFLGDFGDVRELGGGDTRSKRRRPAACSSSGKYSSYTNPFNTCSQYASTNGSRVLWLAKLDEANINALFPVPETDAHPSGNHPDW